MHRSLLILLFGLIISASVHAKMFCWGAFDALIFQAAPVYALVVSGHFKMLFGKENSI